MRGVCAGISAGQRLPDFSHLVPGGPGSTQLRGEIRQSWLCGECAGPGRAAACGSEYHLGTIDTSTRVGKQTGGRFADSVVKSQARDLCKGSRGSSHHNSSLLVYAYGSVLVRRSWEFWIFAFALFAGMTPGPWKSGSRPSALVCATLPAVGYAECALC